MNGLLVVLYLLGANFPICTETTNSQNCPTTIYANNQYYVFWYDCRYYAQNSTYAIFGSRVTTGGTVLDYNGKELFRDSSYLKLSCAYDGINFMVVARNGC